MIRKSQRQPASELAAKKVKVDDTVVLIKCLKVKGRRTDAEGTVLKSIQLTDSREEIDYGYGAIEGRVLRTGTIITIAK